MFLEGYSVGFMFFQNTTVSLYHGVNMYHGINMLICITTDKSLEHLAKLPNCIYLQLVNVLF